MVLPFVYLDKKDVCGARKIGPSKLAVMVKTGQAPAPERHGTRALWRSDVIARWLEEQTQKAQAEDRARTAAATEKAQRMVSARKAA